MSEPVFGSWAAEALVASTFLMVAVLALRLPAQRVFGARIAYALWALPALRLILPRMPGWDVDRFRVALTVEPGAPALTAGGAAAPIDPALLASLPPVAPAFDWTPALLALWLGGAVLHFAWQIGIHRRFMARALDGAAVRRRDLGVAIVAGPAVPGPLATGLLNRAILLPADFMERYAPRERRLVLAHEMAHHARGDLWSNLIGLAVLSLHWFNPLAHIAYRAFRADQELACDETVLATAAGDAPGWYGQAVVKSAAPRFPAAACAMHGMGLVKRRLRMMGRAPAGTIRTLAGAAIGTALVCGGLVVTASGGQAQDAPVAAPAVPTAPAVPAVPAPGSETRKHRHVYVNGDHVIVDGRVVDPRSAEGRRITAEARAAGNAARAAGEEARKAGRAAADAERRAAEAARTAWADMPEPPAPPAPPSGIVPPAPPAPPVIVMRRDGTPFDEEALERAIEQGIDDKALERDIERGLHAAERTQARVAMIDGRVIAVQARTAAAAGMAQARIGLRHARAAIAAADMPEYARSRALASIDREIARMDGQ